MLKIACLPFNPIQENTYVLWDETNECVVIDAGNSSPREDAVLDNFIAEHGLSDLMDVVNSVPSLRTDYVPRDSIVREFVGDSIFQY